MKILLIEDDRELADSMRFQLEKEGYETDICDDGEEGLYYMKERSHDLVILDRMLPSMDGITVLQEARKNHVSTPVIMLTALGELQDKLTGLKGGADDYMVKPFAFEELLARIQCMVRRPGRWEDTAVLSLGDLIFDPESGRLEGNGKECTLSKREADLFEVLIKNPGQILPRSVLFSRVWGPDAPVEDGNLDNYIHFLRRRLKSVGSLLQIKTIRGVGYQLEGAHV